MRVCVIDPEVNEPAYAVFQDGLLVEVGRIPMYAGAGRRAPGLHHEFFRRLRGLASRTDMLVIEDQYVPHGKPERIRTVKTLISARGKVEVEWDRQGKPVELLDPWRWTKMFARRGGPKRREELLPAYRQYARDVARRAGVAYDGTDTDIAAAICMGVWWHKESEHGRGKDRRGDSRNRARVGIRGSCTT